MPKKPIIIYVSGSPGSGKTTLANIISEKLMIPHISSDLIHGGERFTVGKPNDRHRSLLENFIPLMINLADKNISFTVDQVLQKDLSENDIIDKIKSKGNLIYIHTWCSNPIERHLRREYNRIDEGISQYDLDKVQREKRAHFHRSNLSATNEPLELGLPTIVINTDDGYSPGVKEILEFIVNTRDESNIRGA